MFVYNISELLESLKSAQDEGFEYVSLSILDPDEEDDDLDCETVVLDYVHDSSRGLFSLLIVKSISYPLLRRCLNFRDIFLISRRTGSALSKHSFVLYSSFSLLFPLTVTFIPVFSFMSFSIS